MEKGNSSGEKAEKGREEFFDIEKTRREFADFQKRVIEAEKEGKSLADLEPYGPLLHLEKIETQDLTPSLLEIVAKTMKIRKKSQNRLPLTDNEEDFILNLHNFIDKTAPEVQSDRAEQTMRQFEQWAANLLQGIYGRNYNRKKGADNA